tara:strand:+ start:324 stop:464 length:141 start_codon:yes stop_codon:yes gene_type:complete
MVLFISRVNYQVIEGRNVLSFRYFHAFAIAIEIEVGMNIPQFVPFV